MNISTLYTDLLDSIVQAQYKTYVFSQNLGGEVNDSLFPIPVAEIRELTLDLSYAYVKDEDNDVTETEVSWPSLYKHIEPVFSQITQNVRNLILSNINPDLISDPDWSSIKNNLQNGLLDKYSLSMLEEKFYNNERQLVYLNMLNQTVLVQLVKQNMNETMLQNDQLAKYINGTSLQSLADDIVTNSLQQKRADLQKAYEAAIKKKKKLLNITIDADELKALPSETIQHARIVLDIRAILNEKK
jgi:hypothetical protein